MCAYTQQVCIRTLRRDHRVWRNRWAVIIGPTTEPATDDGNLKLQRPSVEARLLYNKMTAPLLACNVHIKNYPAYRGGGILFLHLIGPSERCLAFELGDVKTYWHDFMPSQLQPVYYIVHYGLRA